MRLARIAALAVLIFGLTGSALSQERRPISPQERNQYVISVRAGAVNIVEGDVTFQNENGKWDLLIAGDSLSDGNRVKTGQDGRAEILLSPGSYLRLSKNTEIVFTETALDRLKIEVLNGCAYVEAARTDWDPGLLATVVTPQGEFFIAKGGLYRFNVTPDNRTEALVRKGRLLMRDSSIPRGGKKAWIEIPTDYGTMKVAGVGISENKRVVVEGGQPAIFSFKKEYEDEFDLWSKDRAKTLIAGNRRLKGRSGLGPVNVSAWVLDPFHGGFWFWPAYYGFRSPYGWSYSVCNNPTYPAYRNSGNGGYNGGGHSYGGGTRAGGGSSSGGGVRGGGVRSGGVRSGGSASGGMHGGARGAAPSAPARGNNRRP